MFIVVSLDDMVMHICIWFEQKSELCWTFRGGGIQNILQHLYLNDCAEFDS